jgi:hypothetical protein
MSSKNVISADYLERRGSETKGNNYKGDNGSYGSVDIQNILLGQSNLTRTSISPFNYNYVYQFFISKGTDEISARSMVLIINDIAKLRNTTVQHIITEMDREYTTKLENPVVRAKANVVIENEIITQIQVIDNGIGFYDVAPTITIEGDGVYAEASLTLEPSGVLTPTIINAGLQYTYATANITPVQIIKDFQIYIPNHKFKTGDNVYFTPLVSTSTMTSLPFGLEQLESSGKPKIYYVIDAGNNYIKLATSEKNTRLMKCIEITEAPLDGGFIISRSFNFNVSLDSFMYMNEMRPVTKQMMLVESAKTSDTARFHRLLP